MSETQTPEHRPKSVLFVDDEPLVLSGLRRMLGQHAEWCPQFAESAEAALQRLEREPYDVLVTDLRMPKMDGLSLLRQTAERFPGVVRIAISGHVEEAMALRAIPMAHLFLVKPCRREALLGALERAHRVHQLVLDPELREAIGGTTSLPSRPRVYAQLTEALAEPDVSIDEVARIIERDLALSAKLLHIVNCALLAPVHRISNVRAAVTRAGLRRIKFLVLSAEVFQLWRGSLPGWSIDEVFSRSLQVAELAMRLLDEEEAREDAFLAGLLHDLGQLVLAGRAPKRLEQSLAAVQSSGTPLPRVEQQLYGVGHAEVGAYLLGLWGLPYPIMEAVAYHHRPEAHFEHGLDVASAVMIAALLLEEPATGSSALTEPLLGHLGLDPALFDVAHWRACAAALRARR